MIFTDRKKRSLTFIGLFIVIFGALLTIATFFDLQIDRFLTRGILPPNSYDCNNAFGSFFEIIGDCPTEVMVGFSFDILFIYALRNLNGAKRKIAMILSAVLSVVAGYVLCMIVFDRIETHILLGLDVELAKGLYLNLVYVFFGVVSACLGILAVNNFSDESIRQLLRFAAATIIFSLLSAIAINLSIKDIVGRMRFRAMNAYPDNEIVGFKAYSRWYELKGHTVSDELMMKLYGHTDANKSFPSGHTGSAGATYAMIMLIDALKIKKKSKRAALWIIPIAYTGTVAVSRMMIGAHFMSDVLFGGTLSFILMLITREIIILKGANVKAIFSKQL